MTSEGQIDNNDYTVDTEGELEILKKALAEEKTKSEANLAGWQRAQADLINYRKRCEQEMEETTRFANAALILTLLPVLDDFERAFNSFPVDQLKPNSGWIEGVRLVERKLRTTLEMQGLSHIKTVGEPFDPRIHEAVRQAAGKEGTIIQELVKGYKLHDKVLRPAKVMVGNGEDLTEETKDNG